MTIDTKDTPFTSGLSKAQRVYVASVVTGWSIALVVTIIVALATGAPTAKIILGILILTPMFGALGLLAVALIGGAFWSLWEWAKNGPKPQKSSVTDWGW